MALQIQYSKFGLDFPNAYLKINGGQFNKERALVSCNIYASHLARVNNEEPLASNISYELILPSDSVELFSGMYGLIKEQWLPEALDI